MLPHFGIPASLYIVWPISWAVTAVTLAIIFLLSAKYVYQIHFTPLIFEVVPYEKT